MAEALVGGAFLSAALNVLFERIASRQVLDFFKGQKPNAQLLRELKTKMMTINQVLDDAEDKQHTKPNVKQWLDELKDVVYEAEDFLDEIASQVQRSKIEAESQTPFEKVQDFASSSSHFGSGKKEKLEEILKRLEDLINQKNDLGLKDGAGEKSSFQRPPTTSLPDESVIGRDADKKAIMEWLLSDGANNTNPDVLAIVGMGGLGKTTLAQVVYSDSRADDYFDQKAWVYVSEEFNVSKITKDILQGFSKKSLPEDNLDRLQNELKKDLTEKKFLLILDDVWNKQYSEWDQLLKPLRYGEKGSKIFVTTRDEEVAQIIQTRRAYQLEKLSENDCWLLFQKHAFIGRDSSPALPDLERIGRQIIKKCDGLPLATKALGGTLRSKEDPRKWMKILKSDMWNVQNDSIIPVLRLSYRFLPSPLKRCFAYCAVFPKGYKFKKEQLIHLWMAEGLLSLPIEEVEEAAEDCFNDLVSRFGVDKSREVVERVHHLWFDDKIEHEEVNNWMLPTQRLRTFLYEGWRWPKNVDAVEVQNSLLTSTNLRVLCFHGKQMIKLPDSIGNLILLRYLDLSYSLIERLPDSVSSLCNLETLILYRCARLVELPATTFKLINLCQLDVRGTKLRNMPPRMGKLRKLGELAYFIVGTECDYSIKQVGELKRLQGCLCIEKLENILQAEESTAANLKCKEKLKILELKWSDEGSEGSVHVRNVLEQLQPHSNIEQLSIYGYAGTRFPDWVGESSFSSMVELKLERCRYCWSLPPLGQLGSLKRLSIIEFDVITVLGPEFYGNSNMRPFGCLEYLRFERMQEWQEWVPYSNMDKGGDVGATAAFPLLQVLTIEECPKLKKALPAHLPSLTKLEIKGCEQLASIPRAPAIQLLIKDLSPFMSIKKSSNSGLQRLEVSRWEWPDSLPQMAEQLILMAPNILTTVHDITISGCDSLTSFPLDKFPLLENIKISDCPNLETLSAATTEADAENLKSLTIEDCPNLKRIQPTRLTSLTKLVIRGSDQLSSLPGAPTIQKFEIKDNSRDVIFGKMDSSSELPSLHINRWSLASDSPLEVVKQLMAPNSITLENLVVSCWDSVTSFPVDLFPISEALMISDCPRLESLSAAASEAQPLQHCKSLRLSRCPYLKRLPESKASLFPSLVDLSISYCPEVGPVVAELHRQIPNLSDLALDGSGGEDGSWCQQLGSFPPEGMLLPFFLTFLKIWNFPNLKSFHNLGLQSLSSLKGLEIGQCPNLESLGKTTLQFLPSFRDLRIFRCPTLQTLPELPPTLTSLTLVRLQNMEFLANISLKSLTSLRALWIAYCPKLQSLQMPSTLTSLKCVGFEDVESLDHLELNRLTSLTKFYIFDCPKLQSIVKEGLPSSLQKVDIIKCPLLKVGQDWPFKPPPR